MWLSYPMCTASFCQEGSKHVIKVVWLLALHRKSTYSCCNKCSCMLCEPQRARGSQQAMLSEDGSTSLSLKTGQLVLLGIKCAACLP